MKSIICSCFVFVSLSLLQACGSSKETGRSKGGEIFINETPSPASSTTTTATTNTTATYEALQIKYAKYINVPPQQITNIQLYRVIDYWLNTPYKWGGTDKRGIDCSAFVQKLLADGYGIYIQRTSNEQFVGELMNRFASTKHLAEGDLVFFKTMDNGMPVSHVGMYLDNNMFVNSSSSKGVSIANLKDPYWSTKYVGAGRVIVQNKQSAKK